MYTPAGILRGGLGKGARGKVKLYGRRTGQTSGYTSKMMRKINLNPRYRLSGYSRGSKEELKFFDTAIALTFPTVAVCSTSGATGNIHIVPQDDTQSGRDGRQIWIKSIQIRGEFALVPTTDATSISIAYLALILDTQCNGANPAITDVFTTNDMSSNMLNLSNDNRFQIIKRWKVTLVSTAGVTTAYNQNARPMDWYKRCNIPITFDNTVTTGAITSTRQNSIFMAQGSGIDNQITFDGTCRIRFTG